MPRRLQEGEPSRRLGVIIGGQTGVPDHLVAGDREKVNRAIEMIGLIKLDLEVEGLRRFAGPSQPVDVGSIGATEPAQPHTVHAPMGPKPDTAGRWRHLPAGHLRFGASPFVVIIGTT